MNRGTEKKPIKYDVTETNKELLCVQIKSEMEVKATPATVD